MENQAHTAALDRIGRSRVQSHYNLSDRAWQKWRKGGVPRIHLKSLALLASVNGIQVPELGA